MRPPTIWAAPSGPLAAHSTTPTGRPTPNCGCAASVSCSKRLRDHADELRELAIAEVGAPRMLTAMAQFDGPVEDLSFCADTAESLSVDDRSGHRRPDGHQDASHHRARGRSASSAPSRRGTSRIRSTSPRSDLRWPRATRSCSSRHPTPRGAQRYSAS